MDLLFIAFPFLFLINSFVIFRHLNLEHNRYDIPEIPIRERQKNEEDILPLDDYSLLGEDNINSPFSYKYWDLNI